MKKIPKLKYWSYSSWAMFNLCKYRWMRRYLLGEREPEGKALIRGNKIHKEAEDFLKGKLKKLPKTLRHFAHEYKVLKSLEPMVEQFWGFDDKLRPTTRKKQTLIVKMDAAVKPKMMPGRILMLQDLKTGNDYPTHAKQASLYAATGVQKFPEARGVEVELWYSDSGLVWPLEYSLERIKRLRRYWIEQGRKMFAERTFAKTPSEEACQWCPRRSDRKGGDCKAWKQVRHGNIRR